MVELISAMLPRLLDGALNTMIVMVTCTILSLPSHWSLRSPGCHPMSFFHALLEHTYLSFEARPPWCSFSSSITDFNVRDHERDLGMVLF